MRISISTLMFSIVLMSLAHAQPQVSQTNNNSRIPVTVQRLSELLVQRELTAPAEVLSINNAEIASEIIGVIETIAVDVGQQVKAGEVLVTLQSVDYGLALEQAQASLQSTEVQIEQAKQRLDRANTLIKSKHISADELLDRQTDLKVFKAQKKGLQISIKQAQRNVQKTQIVAPFDGVVELRMAQTGSFVNAGTVLLRLVESYNSEVDADVAMQLSNTLTQADEIFFSVNQTDYAVKLTRLSPIVNSGLRTQKARLTFVDKRAPIGTSGSLIWRLNQGLLPADLVVNRNQQLGVFVATGNKAIFTPIFEAQEGRPVPVNLSGETSIIVGGRERLQDGDAIVTQ